MISLRADALGFSFPAIGEALKSLVENHIQTTLARILAEDREWTVAALDSEWWFKRASQAEKQTARELIRAATPAQIEAVLRKKCLAMAQLDQPDDVANVRFSFQRTLRIPDDGKIYPLPAGLGDFPLRLVDDFTSSAPESWVKRGGVMMPMHQSEALWISFRAGGGYPFAVKVGAGKINSVTGEAWAAGLQRDPQNYLVLPDQPWLDGFAVSKGVIRQFVAMPLGDGYSAEEQLTGRAEAGGIQLQVFPLKAEAWFRKHLAGELPSRLEDMLEDLVGRLLMSEILHGVAYSPLEELYSSDMGLCAGGKMRQEIYKDPHDFSDWDTAQTSRCFVHICDSLVWRQITGAHPPHPPATAKEYARARIPWFDYYRDDLSALKGSKLLAGVKSVLEMGQAKGTAPLPENTTVSPEVIVQYGNTRRPEIEVREWEEW